MSFGFIIISNAISSEPHIPHGSWLYMVGVFEQEIFPMEIATQVTPHHARA